MLPVVRILGKGAASQICALLLGTLFISGCSLKSANDGARLSLVLPNPRGLALAQSSGLAGLAPANWTGFACYGVNVTGPGIADSSRNPKTNTDTSALFAGATSCAYRGVVSNGFTFSAGQSEASIELQVPPGASRVIQLVGITNAAYCNSNFLENDSTGSPGAYEIGRVKADLFGDASVSIPIQYTASELKRVDCGGSAATVLAVGFNTPVSAAYASVGNQAAFSVSGSCTEVGQPVVLKANGSPIGSAITCSGASLWSSTIDLSGQVDGAIVLTADHLSASSVAAPQASVSINKDTVPPGSASVAIAAGAVYTTSLSVSLNLAATGATEAYITGTAGCGAGGVWTAYATTSAWNLASANVTNNVYVKFRDAALNESACISDSIIHDSTNPTPSSALVWAQASPYNSGTVTANWVKSVSGDLSTQFIQLYSDGTCVTPSGASIDLASSTLQTKTFTGLIDGLYSFKLKSVDLAGNFDMSTCSPAMTIDTIAPSVAIVSPAPATIINTLSSGTNLTLVGNCSENGLLVNVGSGAASTSATCTGGAWTAVLNISVLSAGNFTVNVTQTDAAGNISVTATRIYAKEDTVVLTRVSALNSTLSPVFTVRGAQAGDQVILTVGADAACQGGRVNGAWSASDNLPFSATAIEAFTFTGSENFRAQVVKGGTTSYCSPIVNYDYPLQTAASSVAVGKDAVCILTASGGVRCSGDNSYSQLGDGTAIPRTTFAAVKLAGSPLTGATAIAAGDTHACALVGSSVYCWGYNANGQLGDATNVTKNSATLVSGLSSVTAISAGYLHTCALLSNGTVWCWGYNSNSQLGDGTTTSSNIPVQVSSITAGTSLSAGGFHSCAVDSGNLKCWGLNTYGQIGDTTTTQRSAPVTVASGITSVAAGTSHTCAVAAGGTVSCWGLNTQGQIGDGTTTVRLSPVAVSGVASASAVSIGANHSCALISDGTTRCWGANPRGQLGSGTAGWSATALTPSITGSGSKISARSDTTCVSKSDSTVQCWGANPFGQFGNGNSDFRILPEPVVASGFASVSIGTAHSCAVDSGGVMSCWGDNTYGQLGNNTSISSFSPISPSSVGGTVSMAALGGAHTCALLSSGGIKCWGSNPSGQLGNGTTTSALIPGAVTGVSTATAVAAGISHTCALLSDLTVQCWGINPSGQLGNGTTTQSTTPVAVSGITTATAITAGVAHSCALLTGGTVKCWGSNSNGQLGIGNTTNQTVPATTLSITNAVSISAAGNQTCAALADGTGKCWGANTYGQLGDGTNAGKLTPVLISGSAGYANIRVGPDQACARTSVGRVKCWGRNQMGQLGTGLSAAGSNVPNDVWALYQVSNLAVGGSQACAVGAAGKLSCWGSNAYGQLGFRWEALPSTILDLGL